MNFCTEGMVHVEEEHFWCQRTIGFHTARDKYLVDPTFFKLAPSAMNDTPKYPQSAAEPESLNQMAAMMAGKPAPPIEDQTTVAIRLVFAIYLEFKSNVLLGDKTPESIRHALREARERTVREVSSVMIRANAAARYDAMLERLTDGGGIEI